MKVLLYSPIFSPENSRINVFVKELKKIGHDITVITSIPNYPKGDFFPGYGYFKKRNEITDGIKIHRCFTIPRKNGSKFNLLFNYISILFGGLITTTKLRNLNFDIVFVFQVSPISIALPAIYLKFFKKKKIIIWTLDLWPESIKVGGNLKTNFLSNIFKPLVKFIYKQVDIILISSPGFKNKIKKYSISDEKIIYFPQWVDQFPVNNPIINLVLPNDCFKIFFAGNFGESQNLIKVIEAFSLIKNDKIKLYLVGSGRKKNEIVNYIKNNNVTNAHLIGQYKYDEMPHVLYHANAFIISLKKNEIFELTIPAKLQTYMSLGKPIISFASGITNSIVSESGSGISIESNDVQGLQKAIEKISSEDLTVLNKMGNNAKRYALENFSKESLLKLFNEVIQKL
jgi:glycosyltransferase involved in cell wall biosynthesis